MVSQLPAPCHLFFFSAELPVPCSWQSSGGSSAAGPLQLAMRCFLSCPPLAVSPELNALQLATRVSSAQLHAPCSLPSLGSSAARPLCLPPGGSAAVRALQLGRECLFSFAPSAVSHACFFSSAARPLQLALRFSFAAFPLQPAIRVL